MILTLGSFCTSKAKRIAMRCEELCRARFPLVKWGQTRIHAMEEGRTPAYRRTNRRGKIDADLSCGVPIAIEGNVARKWDYLRPVLLQISPCCLPIWCCEPSGKRSATLVSRCSGVAMSLSCLTCRHTLSNLCTAYQCGD